MLNKEVGEPYCERGEERTQKGGPTPFLLELSTVCGHTARPLSSMENVNMSPKQCTQILKLIFKIEGPNKERSMCLC